jgi:sugar (pentulose or hexulose) kinase
MNPFNQSPLTESELKNDCLCYLSFSGRPVKASRLYAGYEYDQQLEKLAEYFQIKKDFFWQAVYDPAIVNTLKNDVKIDDYDRPSTGQIYSRFIQRELSDFKTPESAYHQLMIDLMELQAAAIRLIISDSVKKIFVDGGFARNPVYMHLLAGAFPSIEVFSSHVAQASATGAAMAIHEHWNKKEVPADIIELRYFQS